MFIVIFKWLYGNSYGKGVLILGCMSDMIKDFCGDENLVVIYLFINFDWNIMFCNKMYFLVKV